MDPPANDGGRIQSPINENSSNGKSCKGCLYYSSALNSKSKNPRCIGIPRTLPQVPAHVFKEVETQMHRDDQKLYEFKYSCIGYSVHMEEKKKVTKQGELPFCVGLEIITSKKAEESHADNVLVHSNKKEDDLTSPHPRPYKPAPMPAPPAREEFITRFTKSATLVASGVVKNGIKVCNMIKSTIDDIMYPYRRPPK